MRSTALTNFHPRLLPRRRGKGFAWVPLTKVAAKEIIQAAEEAELKEVQGVTIEEEDGVRTLYFDGPDAEGEESEGEGPPEEPEEPEEEEEQLEEP